MNKHGIKPAGTAEHHDTLQNWLYLRHTDGVGNRTLHTLLESFGSVDGIFNASHKQLSALRSEGNIKSSIISALCNEERPDISADLAWLNQDSSHQYCDCKKGGVLYNEGNFRINPLLGTDI